MNNNEILQLLSIDSINWHIIPDHDISKILKNTTNFKCQRRIKTNTSNVNDDIYRYLKLLFSNLTSKQLQEQVKNNLMSQVRLKLFTEEAFKPFNCCAIGELNNNYLKIIFSGYLDKKRKCLVVGDLEVLEVCNIKLIQKSLEEAYQIEIKRQEKEIKRQYESLRYNEIIREKQYDEMTRDGFYDREEWIKYKTKLFDDIQKRKIKEFKYKLKNETPEEKEKREKIIERTSEYYEDEYDYDEYVLAYYNHPHAYDIDFIYDSDDYPEDSLEDE